MKKSVYLLMFFILMKGVLGAFDLESFFTSNIKTIDFILFTAIFVSVIKLVLKGKFGEETTGNVLYFTFGIALAAAAVFYGELSLYNIGMLIFEFNYYIMLAFLAVLWWFLYKAIPMFGPFKYRLIKFLTAGFIVIVLGEKAFPGVFSQFLDSDLVNKVVFFGIILLILWGFLAILNWFRRDQIVGAIKGGAGLLKRSGGGLWRTVLPKDRLSFKYFRTGEEFRRAKVGKQKKKLILNLNEQKVKLFYERKKLAKHYNKERVEDIKADLLRRINLIDEQIRRINNAIKEANKS